MYLPLDNAFRSLVVPPGVATTALELSCIKISSNTQVNNYFTCTKWLSVLLPWSEDASFSAVLPIKGAGNKADGTMEEKSNLYSDNVSMGSTGHKIADATSYKSKKVNW